MNVCFPYKHPYYEADTHQWGWTDSTYGSSRDGEEKKNS